MGSNERSIKSAPPRRSARRASHQTHSHDDDGFFPFGLRSIDTLFLSPASSPRSNILHMYTLQDPFHTVISLPARPGVTALLHRQVLLQTRALLRGRVLLFVLDCGPCLHGGFLRCCCGGCCVRDSAPRPGLGGEGTRWVTGLVARGTADGWGRVRPARVLSGVAGGARPAGGSPVVVAVGGSVVGCVAFFFLLFPLLIWSGGAVGTGTGAGVGVGAGAGA